MKVLFLDFDGVLNSVAWFITNKTLDMFLDPNEVFKANMDPSSLRLLQYVAQNVSDLKIVISSSWRTQYSLDEIRTAFVSMGFQEIADRIIDRTPKKMSSERCNEVLLWLEDNKVDQWMTLDDRHIFYSGEYSDQEVKTDNRVGLTVYEAFRIVKYFNVDFKEPVVLL